MADKKKKFLSAKETVPRRPVILKSDRETPKENDREKPKEKPREKERQPTILLKAREQSTPKDENRALSPKLQQANESDGQIPQPSKIAQHENKDRKVIDHKACVPIPAMLEPIKLLDENFEFNSAAGEYLNDTNNNYLVVGIVGGQGVGKSMVLNLLAHDKSMDGICSKIVSLHESLSIGAYDENEPQAIEEQLEALNFIENAEPDKISYAQEEYFKFKMQDINQIERGQHCTKGVDMYVTNDRVVLLDCQGMCSPSALEEGATSGATPVTLRGSTVATMDCLQVASYLMSVCHVLIAVQDWFTDFNFLRFLQTAEMLKPSLSASSSAAAAPEGGECAAGELLPHLLLLQNHCQLEDFQPPSVQLMQDLYRKVFRKSKLQLHSGMYMYSDSNRNGLNIDAVRTGLNVETCGVPLNLFLLPEIYEDYENRDIYRGHPPFEDLAARLRWTVFGASRHQLTNVANLSEKGWFHYSGKAWETIRKSTFFMEYGRLLP